MSPLENSKIGMFICLNKRVWGILFFCVGVKGHFSFKLARLCLYDQLPFLREGELLISVGFTPSICSEF